MKLLVDMNLSPQWVERLTAAGLPAVHWSEVGRMDAPDTEIMAYAAEHGYVVVTHDLDFSAILAATQGSKPSVVQIRSENLSPAVIGISSQIGLKLPLDFLHASAIILNE